MLVETQGQRVLFENDASRFHDVAPVGDIQGRVGVLLDQENGHFLFVSEFADQLENLPDDHGQELAPYPGRHRKSAEKSA